MKHTFHIATGQYEFIEQEFEGTPEEAVAAYNDLKRAYDGGEGMGMKEYAKVIVELVRTGGVKQGGNNDYSANESALLGAITKLLREEKR